MRIILIAVFVVFTSLPSASQMRFGATGGVAISSTNMSEFQIKDARLGDYDITSSSRINFMIGLVAERILGNQFTVRPQLYFVTKGDLVNYESTGGTSGGTSAQSYEEKYSYNYLEMPINFVYNSTGRSGRLFIGGGPAVAYALYGKYKKDDEAKSSMDFYLEDVNRLDIGLNILAGYEIKGGLFFNINYTHGLRSIYKESDLKNRVIGLSIGKFF